MGILETNLQTIHDVVQKSEAATYSWFRYIVGMASGVLSVTLALDRDVLSGQAATTAKVAITSLALGILFGTVRLYGEVWRLRAHRKNLVGSHIKQIQDNRIEPLATSNVKLPALLRVCGFLCYVSFIAFLAAMIARIWLPLR